MEFDYCGSMSRYGLRDKLHLLHSLQVLGSTKFAFSMISFAKVVRVGESIMGFKFL